MLDYPKLKAFRRTDTYTWTDRDVMLYALSVGVGRDPMNEDELPFVYEGRGNLKVLPTFPAVLPRFEFLDGYGITFARLLHGESRLTLYSALPPAGAVKVETFVNDIYDKGPGRGALMCMESRAVFADTGVPAYTMLNHTFATADGGFGGPSGGPERQRVPDRKPDRVVRFQTREDQALLYRLNGDRNPLHADPEAARAFKFPRPIMHGLCSYAISGWIITRDLCGYDQRRIASIDVRFTSPLFPGEPLEFDLWQDGDVVAFRARAPERNVVGLDDGRCVLKP